MKRWIYILIVVVWCLGSCQVVKEEDRYIAVPNPDAEKTALLVEFSGLTCVNCPDAAEKAAELLKDTNINLVVVEMHPATSPFTKTVKKEYDYTCKEADEYFLHFGGEKTTSFPTGVINFKEEGGSYFVDKDEWATRIVKEQMGMPSVDISMAPTLEDKKLHLEILLGNHESADLITTLLVWVVEDGIVGAQTMQDGTANLNYTHNHILRAAIGGTWGEEYAIARNGVKKVEMDYEMSADWTTENCSVVAVALDEVGEVSNVTKVELK